MLYVISCCTILIQAIQSVITDICSNLEWIDVQFIKLFWACDDVSQT